MSVWGGQYREELTLNDTVKFVSVSGGIYSEELILNVTLVVVLSGEFNTQRNRY